MKHTFITFVLAFSILALPSPIAAQATEPDETPAAASAPVAPDQAGVPAPAPARYPAFDRPISLKLLLPNLVSDQKRIWSFPSRLANSQNLIPTAAIVGTGAGLLLFDPTEATYFRRTSTFHAFNNVFTGNATLIGTIVTPASLYALGLIRKDSKMQHTGLLAGEAVANAELLTTVLKDATRRVRPAGFRPSGNYSDSWFESSGSVSSYVRGNGSFPSGHTIAAFSVATIIARRYGSHRWVPYAAYGVAAVVGFSRLSLSAHFVSDVFVGGALGYSISRFAVLQQ